MKVFLQGFYELLKICVIIPQWSMELRQVLKNFTITTMKNWPDSVQFCFPNFVVSTLLIEK